MPDLRLDPETHRYTLDGRSIGGVTEILTALGIIDPRWYTDYARERGTAVHRAIEYMLRGRLDWTSLDERIAGYVRAAHKFAGDVGLQPVDIERRVYHPELHYAGTLDVVGFVLSKPTVLDWKSGGLGHASLATAAYEQAYRNLTPMARMAVQLRPDGTYRKTSYEDPADHADWLAIVRIYNRYHARRVQ